jgi:hypothetical protein
MLKNSEFEMNSSISQIKMSIKSLVNRVEQVENGESGTENKEEELDQTAKDHKKF